MYCPYIQMVRTRQRLFPRHWVHWPQQRGASAHAKGIAQLQQAHELVEGRAVAARIVSAVQP